MECEGRCTEYQLWIGGWFRPGPPRCYHVSTIWTFWRLAVVSTGPVAGTRGDLLGPCILMLGLVAVSLFGLDERRS